MTAGAVSLIKATNPKTLGKTYTLTTEGLKKTVAGELVEGCFTVETFSTVREFSALLQGLGNDSALCASLPVKDGTEGRIVTKAALRGNPGAITRTKADFGFASRPGVLVLDYDVPSRGQALSRDDLWRLLCDICPTVREAGVVWWSSGSSFIFNGDVELQGLRGQRLYILVADATDTVRFCDSLSKGLWLAGRGHIAISASGSKLVRGVFDEAMAQPARLDFAGGAICLPPLEQRRDAPVVLSSGGFLNTRIALPELNADEEARYIALVEASKAAKEPEALATREAWKAARHGSEVARLVSAGVPILQAHERATKTLESALQSVLLGDFLLTLADGSTVTVGQAMDDPDRWHGTELRDPLEPEYLGGKSCAKLFLYALCRQSTPSRVAVVRSSSSGNRRGSMYRRGARPNWRVRCWQCSNASPMSSFEAKTSPS